VSLLCLHGFTGSPRVWEPVLDRLPGITAWCPTLLGHGSEEDDASATAPGHRLASRHGVSTASTFAGEVDRLASWLGAHTDQPCHLLAYSLGARLGLGLLLGYPQRFTGATLVGVHPGLADGAERTQRAALDEARAQGLEADGVEVFIDHWQKIPLFASQQDLPSEVLARQREHRLGHQAAGLARALRVLGLASMPDYLSLLPTLKLPVELVVGQEDDKFCRLAETMAEALPRAAVLRVPRVGHNVVLEAPEAVAETVPGTVAEAVVGGGFS